VLGGAHRYSLPAGVLYSELGLLVELHVASCAIHLSLARAENVLNFLNCLLLLHVSLSEAFENLLLMALQTFGFAVLLADFDNLLLDDLVFDVAHVGPLLGGHTVNFLLCLGLLLLDHHAFLYQLAHLPLFLSLFLLCNFDAFLLYLGSLLHFDSLKLLPGLGSNSCLSSDDGGVHSRQHWLLLVDLLLQGAFLVQAT